MDRRTKILASVFGVAVVYALLSSVVYPRWIRPFFTIDEQIARRARELERLQAAQERFDEAAAKYRDFVARVGSYDANAVANEVRRQLDELIEKYGFQGAGTTPGRSREDRRTGLVTRTITVSGSGTLQSAIRFLRDVEELPQLIRVTNPTLYPASSSRRRRRRTDVEMVQFSVPVELWVLPRQRLLRELDPSTLPQPTSIVRHSDRSYELIWERTPFTEYIELEPLVADAGRNMTVRQGRRAELRATVKGGDELYRYEWSGGDGIKHPDKRETMVDTSQPGTTTYTLKVMDNSGNTATDTVTVDVQPIVAKATPEPKKPEKRPPPPPPDPRWPDRQSMRLCQALRRSGSHLRVDELMIHDNSRGENVYYRPGDEFDGGELLYVHPRGAVVRRQDEYFVYPLGARLDQDVPVDQADAFPKLKAIGVWLKEQEADARADEAAAAQAVQGSDADTAAPGDDSAEAGGEAGDKPSGAKQLDPSVGPGDSQAGEDAPKNGKPGEPKPGKGNTRGTKSGSGPAGATGSDKAPSNGGGKGNAASGRPGPKAVGKQGSPSTRRTRRVVPKQAQRRKATPGKTPSQPEKK